MPLIPLKSLDDPRLDVYRCLNTSNLTRFSGSFIAEGEKLVRRLVASSLVVESVLLDERFVARVADFVPPDVPVFVTDRRQLEELIGFHFHRGVLACGRRPAAIALGDILPAPPHPVKLVACVNIQDAENLGGILRSSAALGIDCVVLGRHSADPFSRRALRVSMGTAFFLPIHESLDLRADLLQLRETHQIELIATVLNERATHLKRATVPGRLALLLGSEGEGLSAEWLELCDQQVTIPMHRGTDSLNVSSAAGIFIYHFTADRRVGQQGRE